MSSGLIAEHQNRFDSIRSTRTKWYSETNVRWVGVEHEFYAKQFDGFEVIRKSGLRDFVVVSSGFLVIHVRGDLKSSPSRVFLRQLCKSRSLLSKSTPLYIESFDEICYSALVISSRQRVLDGIAKFLQYVYL